MAIVQSGYFTSTGVAKTLILRSDVDYITIFNETEASAANADHGVRYFWRRGLAQGAGFVEYRASAPAEAHILAATACLSNAGFFLVDTSVKTPGAAVAVTAGTNATRPVYSTANTGSVLAGSIVRLIGSDHTNIAGLDFSVDAVTANTEFRLANTLATAPGLVAGAAGSYRMVAQNLDAYKYFYPSNRYIANITQAASAVVTTLVDHGYAIGDIVRMNVPSTCGMTQMDGLLGTITAVSTSTFTVNIDSTTFTAFNFPLPAAVPFTPAEVVCVGGVAAQTAAYADALRNGEFIGITLMPGLLSPAGSNNDVISWQAYKSDNL